MPALYTPQEPAELLLLFGAWIVAFLFGRHLQTGFDDWRARAVRVRARSDQRPGGDQRPGSGPRER